MPFEVSINGGAERFGDAAPRPPASARVVVEAARAAWALDEREGPSRGDGEWFELELGGDYSYALDEPQDVRRTVADVDGLSGPALALQAMSGGCGTLRSSLCTDWRTRACGWPGTRGARMQRRWHG